VLVGDVGSLWYLELIATGADRKDRNRDVRPLLALPSEAA